MFGGAEKNNENLYRAIRSFSQDSNRISLEQMSRDNSVDSFFFCLFNDDVTISDYTQPNVRMMGE
jgi:hypothetical protein